MVTDKSGLPWARKLRFYKELGTVGLGFWIRIYVEVCPRFVSPSDPHRRASRCCFPSFLSHQGRPMPEVPSSQSILSATRHQTVEVLIQESQQWLLQHNYGEALATCDRALALQPHSAKAWLCRGRILSLQNRPEDALNAHRKAANLEKTCVAAWYNQAMVLQRLDRSLEAIAALNQALTLYPRFSEGWFKRGQLLEQGEQYQEALLSYNAAIEMNHYWVKATPGKAWERRGACLDVLGNYHAAAEAYAHALREDPQNWRLHQERVQILQKIGHIEDEKPKDVAPKDPESWGWAL